MLLDVDEMAPLRDYERDALANPEDQAPPLLLPASDDYENLLPGPIPS